MLAVLALASIGLALLFSSAGLLGLLAARSRAFVTAVFAAGAGVLLILDQFHVRDVLLAKISSSQGSSVAGLDPASLFNVNMGIGLWVALVILAVVVVYNAAALVIVAAPAAVTDLEPPQPPPMAPPP
jgi:quinol-cytochrome oxidoreductase complex cytochrome b subunit